MKEEALLAGRYRSLVGVYAPSKSLGHRNLAVVLLNAGLIHHVGPHRLHVKLGRALAARGISTLRVDLSGIGDSSARPDNLPVSQLGFQEPREILDALSQRGYDSFALFGICSGAKHALQTAAGDRRVKGLVLVNQALTTEDPAVASQASAQYYIRRSLWNPRAWLNLLTGRVKYKALFATFAGEVRRRLTAGSQKTLVDIFRKELEPALVQGTRLLVVFSDQHAQFIKVLGDGVQDLQRSGQLQIVVCPEADHLFTSMEEQELLVEQVCRWTQSLQRTTAASL